MKKGILQSRGLGDIVIALPIARHYENQGYEIVWPVCEEFISSLRTNVPWVTWISVPTDAQGKFFLETPLLEFQRLGIKEEDIVYLYHYLSSRPELTDPELYNILKFDQYKYAVAGVPFRDKWTLERCITRDRTREERLRDRIGVTGPYAVVNLHGSNFQANIDLPWIDPAVQIIRVEEWATDNIWDWIGLLEGADSIVCVDSAMANIVDQLGIEGPKLYWIRRSPWDLTPVQGSHWSVVPTNLPIKDPTRVDPAAEARRLAPVQPVYNTAAPSTGLTSHVPFDTDKSKYPTSFLSALRK